MKKIDWSVALIFNWIYLGIVFFLVLTLQLGQNDWSQWMFFRSRKVLSLFPCRPRITGRNSVSVKVTMISLENIPCCQLIECVEVAFGNYWWAFELKEITTFESEAFHTEHFSVLLFLSSPNNSDFHSQNNIDSAPFSVGPLFLPSPSSTSFLSRIHLHALNWIEIHCRL